MNEPALPGSCLYTADSPEGFLDYLLPSAQHWNSAKRGELAYRGHPSAGMRLIPKAFRKDVLVGYGNDARVSKPDRVEPQAQSEFRAVHEFIRAADNCGLAMTEAGGRLLLQNDPRDVFADPHWEYRWPQDVILETLALAQHHGVPTRLLDFSEDPLVAAFFAASLAWTTNQRRRRSPAPRSYLAVYVIDLRFIRALNRIRSRYSERLLEVRVPRANNAYLLAQFAFFLVDRGANDTMAQGNLTSMDRVIVDRANHWYTGDRLAGKGIKQTWFGKFPVKKVRLRTAHAGALLRELENRGVTQGNIMPSLDRVVESLERQRSTLLPG